MRTAGLVVALLAAAPFLASGAGKWVPPEDPNDPRSFTWIEEGTLALGGGGLDHGDVDVVKELGFGAIANFRGEHKDPEDYIREQGLEYVYMPVDHAVDMNATQLREFVDWMRVQRDAGRAAYVHCTNGWHRAAAFSAAWLMAERGLGADEAFAKVKELRGPWAVNRAPSALLAYEAELRGEPGLTVFLTADRARPEPNGMMPAEVHVYANGKPVAGADVRVWGEESKLRIDGETGDDGRFAFTYMAPDASKHVIDHLYARASFDGYVDGADNVELFYFMDVPEPRALDIEASVVPEGVDVRVTRDDRSTAARILVVAENGASAFDATRTGRALLPLDHQGAAVEVIAMHWGDAPARATLAPPPPPPVEEAPPQEPAKAEPPATDSPPATDAAPVAEPPVAEQPPVDAMPPASEEPAAQDAAPAPDAAAKARVTRDPLMSLAALGALTLVIVGWGTVRSARRRG